MQHTLPVAMPPRRPAPLLRPLRRPWTPSPAAGPYRLPPAVSGPLGAALAPFRNADAAFALAVFLARFWSAPSRLERAFPVDRRALTEHAVLGLTEARVRGALRTLEAIGFIERDPAPGSAYRRTVTGPQRRPITFRFGREFIEAFQTANARAQAARGGRSGQRRHLTPSPAPRPSTVTLEASQASNSPTSMSVAIPFLTGELVSTVAKGSPSGRAAPPTEPGSALDTALARLQAAVFAPRFTGEAK